MAWGDVQGKSSGASDHITITPNTTKLVHILMDANEEPVSFWTHYIPGADQSKGRVVICPGKNVCPACKIGTYRTSRRHAINVWDYDSNSVKILEQGNTVMQQLKTILDQFGSFNDIDISIRRIGEKTQTQYILVPIPRQQKFDDSVASGKFDLLILKQPHSIEEIAEIVGVGGATVTTNTASHSVSQPQNANPQPQNEAYTQGGNNGIGTIKEPTVLQFGKYKGKTFEEIAQEDLNYVEWCSKNLKEEDVRAEAEKMYNLHSKAEVFQHTTNPQTAQQPSAPVGKRQELMTNINFMLNNDIRYKGKFNEVLEKMREASKSASHPNGKTLLADYTDDELERLFKSL
jgi:hypothetical protein